MGETTRDKDQDEDAEVTTRQHDRWRDNLRWAELARDKDNTEHFPHNSVFSENIASVLQVTQLTSVSTVMASVSAVWITVRIVL